MKKYNLYGFVAVFLASLFMMGCGGGSDSGDGSDESAPVTKTINQQGGIIEHSSGFKITFPDGAVDSPTSVTISKVSLPGALPSGAQSASATFNIDANGTKMNLPVELNFPVNYSSADTLAVYRWATDKNQWEFAGGGESDEGTVMTNVGGFSSYTVVTSEGVTYKPKPIWFEAPGILPDRQYFSVKVYEYEYENTELSPRIADEMFAIVSPFMSSIRPVMYVPPGKYQFCYEWIHRPLVGLAERRHYIDIGVLNTITITENSSDIEGINRLRLSGPYSTAYRVGNCPASNINIDVGDAGASDFVGTYNTISLLPLRTYEQYHGIIHIRSDGSFVYQEWLNGTLAEIPGNWQFNPASKFLDLKWPASGASFSGTVTGSTKTFVVSGKWSSGSDGKLEFTRP